MFHPTGYANKIEETYAGPQVQMGRQLVKRFESTGKICVGDVLQSKFLIQAFFAMHCRNVT